MRLYSLINKNTAMLAPLTCAFTSSDIDTNDKHKVALFTKLKKDYACIFDVPTCFDLNTLGVKGYVLKKDIILSVCKESDEYIAIYEPLGVYEYSDNIPELIASTQEYLRILFDRLMKTPDKELSNEMLNQKKHIKKIISVA